MSHTAQKRRNPNTEKETSDKRTSEKREKEGKEGVKQTVFWLPRFTYFWLSKSIISEPKKGWKGSLRRKKK